MSWVVWPAVWLSGFVVGINWARVVYQRKLLQHQRTLNKYKQDCDQAFVDVRFKLSLLDEVHTKDVSRPSGYKGRRHAV